MINIASNANSLVR